MNVGEPVVQIDGRLSEAARKRILSRRGEPLLFADWERVLMIHFEVDADDLQRDVPFELDLWDGRAFVSLVAFTMRGMRLRLGGRLAAWLLRPIATHEFLNVRTYVRHGGETGIHFLAEWLSNRLAVRLGPAMFGLPYRFGRIAYLHDWCEGSLRGYVMDVSAGTGLTYRARLTSHVAFELCETAASWRRSESSFLSQVVFETCEVGSLTEWLMERYSAFTCRQNKRRFFRVWHPPWRQCGVRVVMSDTSLIKQCWPWFGNALLIGANFSPGLHDVWMGRPMICGGCADSTAHDPGPAPSQLTGAVRL